MRRLFCALLVLLFGAMSISAQAHGTQEATHEFAHMLVGADTDDSADDDHPDHCALAHCCHPIAVIIVNAMNVSLAARSKKPAQEVASLRGLLPSEIERPKWALATHAVASF
jgi:hypothetical protein